MKLECYLHTFSDRLVVAGLGRLIAELPDLQVRTLQIFNEFPKSWQKIVLSMVKIFSPELNELLISGSDNA